MSKQTKKDILEFVRVGEQYARDVVEKKIPACKWTRLAAERHFKDLKRTDWNYTFNAELAAKACLFCEMFPHTKGKWAATGEPFVLQPWQCFMTMSIYGWVHKAGPKKDKRRFTRALLLVPRKNGKSDLAARYGLKMFANDKEFGAEVFSGATSAKQAQEVFKPAKLMAERSKEFQTYFGVTIMKSNLHILSNGSKFEPVIGKPGDGASPSCSIIDEYHEHADDSLFDTMETGMAAREQPLNLVITTAGDNIGGPCYALQQDLQYILEGTVENDSFWGIIYTIDPDVDWTTEEALRMANPNYGVSADPDRLKFKQTEAVRNSRKQGEFQTKHLDVWIGARQAYFNTQAWLRCSRAGMKMDSFRGCKLFTGLDLASTRDIAAVIHMFELQSGNFAVFPRLYLPQSAVENGTNEKYDGWARDGHLILTDGNMIDYIRIENDIMDVNKRFGISQLAYDPAYAQRTIQSFLNIGMPCVEVRPTVLNFSAPMKHVDGLILSGLIEHDGNPCMNWMISNVVSKTDQKDNVYPCKLRNEAKIDGPVAMIMAMNRAMAGAAEPEPEFQIFAFGR